MLCYDNGSHMIGSLGPFGRLRQYKRRSAVMTTDQFDRVLGQSTLTDKVLSLHLPKTSNENQRSTLRPNEIHRFNNNYISVHSQSFHEDPFVGNLSFNTNSLPAWVTAYLSGPKVPMKLRSCNHPVRKTEAKAADGYIAAMLMFSYFIFKMVSYFAFLKFGSYCMVANNFRVKSL